MKNYKVLALIGGIMGIILTPIAILVFGVTGAFIDAFDEDVDEIDPFYAEIIQIGIPISIIVSAIAIITTFVVKNTKAVGIVLICSGVIMIPATFVMGIVSWILFIVGGILAIRAKPSIVET